MRKTWLGTVGAIITGLVISSGCTTEKIVYQDREPFNPPPDAAAGFLGYYTVTSKQTTCGNCHSEKQTTWAQTAHSGAYKTLNDKGPSVAQAACYTCHTVSSKGNGSATPARGWEVVKDTAYQDVQCESCHGPGNTHVKGPNRTNWPLARLGMPGKGVPAVSMAAANSTCAACHSGAHAPFADEWAKSGHSVVVMGSSGPVANSASCAACHDGKQVLKQWGIITNYIEKDSAGIYPVTCTVCHDPHAKNNPKQLRFPIDALEPNSNLCMKCHDRRTQVVVGGRSTPHAPQGDVMLGTAGYRPQAVQIDSIAISTTHASNANSKLCAGCHIQRYDYTDPAAGGTTFRSTGHRFLALPCVDANGPTDAQNCAYSTTTRSFKGCATNGCHGNSEANAAGAFSSRRATIAILADFIWTDLNRNESLDPAPTDGGYLAIIKRDRPIEIPSGTVTKVTAAIGAFFNMATFAERYANGDRSKGVHNPFLGTALLAGNIAELKAVYPFLPAPPAEVQATVDRILNDMRMRQPSFFKAGGR